jgi:hypothetical protein
MNKMKKMAKKSGATTARKDSFMKPRKKNSGWLSKLSQVADAARFRVSAYSDERRSELEKLARGVIHSTKAKAAAVCRH